MRIPRLETDRLTIREYVLDDLDSRQELMVEAFGFDVTLDDTFSWLDWTVRNYAELANLYQPPYGDRAVVLKSSEVVIGSVGLVPSVVPWNLLVKGETNPIFTSAEFGLFYGIMPSYWGKGFAREAIQPIIDFVFEALNARRVVATTEHDNQNSQRVMEKLGMRLFKNSTGAHEWCQVVGVLNNPELRRG